MLVDEAKCFCAEEHQLINKEGKIKLENLFATPNEIFGSGKDYHYLKPCKQREMRTLPFEGPDFSPPGSTNET